MDFWAVIPVVIAYVVVYCYEGIIMELIAGAWHKWRDRQDRKSKETR